ncbi:hypothetical protein H4582DRAFT_1970321, partial [Lactarius indigo]
MSSSVSPLFQPIRVGTIDLKHRIVMAPLTRYRANKDHVHGELAKTYYTQRSGVPGTLIITEATFIAPQAGGYPNIPVAAWKLITDAVHANGSHIFLQLWALGRTADPAVLKQEGGFDLVAPSPISFENNIKEYVQLYSKAASNAIKAGFDGDEYGGSVENRVRFPLEVVNAVAKTVGAERTAIRISPWSPFQGMGMKDPLPTFTTFIERVRDEHPNLAYIHVVEARINGSIAVAVTDENRAHSNEALRKIWGDRPYIAAGGMERATAIDTVSKYGGLVAFGRHFIANPDLPLRLKEGLSLTRYNRDTFYSVPE